MSEHTDIRIGLPLPLDTSGALLNAIGTMWPEAAVVSQARDLTIRIPANKRAKRVSEKTFRQIRAEALADVLPDDGEPVEVLLERWDTGRPAVAVEAAAEAWQRLAMWAWIVLSSDELAANFIEQQVTASDDDDDGTSRTFTISAAWSDEQTPAAVAAQLRAENEQLRAELATLREPAN